MHIYSKILIASLVSVSTVFGTYTSVSASSTQTSQDTAVSSSVHSTEEVHTTSVDVTSVHTSSTDTHTTEHSGPHIVPPKWSAIPGWYILGLPITNTVFSTWLFMIFLAGSVYVLNIAIRTEKYPRIRAFGLDIISRISAYIDTLLWNHHHTRTFFWILGGLMVLIFSGNIFGLLLDWLVLVSAGEWLGTYLRPIYSDLATTLVLSTTVILLAQLTAIYSRWVVKHFGHYLWNYHGDSTAEKVVNIFIGWLHFAGEFIRIGSLSMRLFLNIFVGAILIAVVVYIGTLIPAFHTGFFQVLALPFWFFELLVAFLQGYIFMTLSSLYIRESLADIH